MVQEINPDVLAIAAQMDAERKQGKLRGFVFANVILIRILIVYRPLHGIPILIKANIGTADKMSTTGNFGILSPKNSSSINFSWIFRFVWRKAPP